MGQRGGGWFFGSFVCLLLSDNKRCVNSKGKIGNMTGSLVKWGDLSARLVYMHTFTLLIDKLKQKTIR